MSSSIMLPKFKTKPHALVPIQRSKRNNIMSCVTVNTNFFFVTYMTDYTRDTEKNEIKHF